MTAGGFSVARGQVPLDKAIKTIGLHEISVVLHPEVRVQVTINVARTEDEAERQARGEDVLAEAGEEEAAARRKRCSRKAPVPQRKSRRRAGEGRVAGFRSGQQKAPFTAGPFLWRVNHLCCNATFLGQCGKVGIER